jgi:hypothetical protein
MLLTRNQTLHLVFPDNLNAQRFCDLVVVLVCTTAGRHDTYVARCGAIVAVVRDQLTHEVYACVYAVCLELEEVQPAAEGVVAMLAGEIHKLCEGAANLCAHMLALCPELQGRCRVPRRFEHATPDALTSTAIWLTTAVWFGNRISLGSCS